MSTRSLKQVQNTGQLDLDTQRPETMAPSVFVENFGKFERVGSTFTHKIHRPLRTMLVGHSKPVNQPEPDDKQALLKKIVRRLTSSGKGYLGAGCSIEFYQNRSHFDRDTIHLFTLYPDRWEPTRSILNWQWLIQFLNHFYTPTVSGYVQDLSGNSPMAATVPVAAPAPEPARQGANTLNPNRRFRDSKECREYCELLISEGNPTGLVGSYMLKMFEKHNW